MEKGNLKIWGCFKIRIWVIKLVDVHQTVAHQPGAPIQPSGGVPKLFCHFNPSLNFVKL